MRILYLNHYAGGPAYGMEYRPYYLAREWVRRGHEVTVVAASQSHVRSRQPAISGAYTRETVDGIDFVWCKTPAYSGNGVGRVRNIAAFLLHLRRYRRWLSTRPDVVIASSTYPADIGAARAIARRHGALLVWEVHDLWPLSPMELGGMSRWHPFILWMQHAENYACRNADLVVSMLPKSDAHLIGHGMAPEKFVYVPNGVDPTEWHGSIGESLPAEHVDAIKRARDAGHVVVAYAGAHGIANALHTLLDAAQRLIDQPVTFLLVGTGPERAALKARAEREGLRNVVMLESVPRAAIPDFLGQTDVVYIGLQRQPLFRFGISPNKLMDYMMAAKPVICAIDAGNDLVGEAGCGLTIEPENADALAAAVQKLAALPPADRARLGQNGREFILNCHTYPVLADRFLEAVRAFSPPAR